MTLLQIAQLCAVIASPIAAALGAFMAVNVRLVRLEARHSASAAELARRCDENRDDIRRQSSRIDELAGSLVR